LTLVISCGCWSYANLGSAKILGVSGTIEALGDYEWEVMRQFGIMSYSILPSVYGDNLNFTFLGGQQHEPIMISTSANYFRDITQEVQEKVGQGRAVIVFFREVEDLESFRQSSFYSHITHKNVILPSDLDEDKDWAATNAANGGQVTLAPAIFGRGTDFKCFDDTLEQAGGVHIIQTFFSQDASEEIQIQGRTARQGKKGSYSLILAESEIKELKLDPAELRSISPKERYNKLRSTWKESQAKLREQNQEALRRAESLDKQSHSYLDALLQGNCEVARQKLRELMVLRYGK